MKPGKWLTDTNRSLKSDRPVSGKRMFYYINSPRSRGEREMVRMFGAEYPYTKNASCMHYPKAGSPVWSEGIAEKRLCIYSASQFGKNVSNDWMLSKRMILWLPWTALTASNTVPDVYRSICTLKYFACSTKKINLQVYWLQAAFLRNMAHTAQQQQFNDVTVCYKTIWTPTHKKPRSSGAFFCT